MAEEEKKTIGKYEIVSELGRGGMGVVFKAWEQSLERFVAIKMLGDQLTNDENLVARFLREARSVADLNHPNIVQVFAVDTHEGRPYFAMEFVEGESLTELIRTSRKVDPKRALNLVKEVATGLSAAHDKGVVHRDIKPDNIMLTKHGGVKVVDFGVARIDDPNTKLTATGMAVGTPNYISPEVCLGLDVDKRSDLFSLGIVFYEMLTGDTPFNADSPLEMMTKVVQAEVPDVTSLNPDIDDGLRMILNHMLEKKPDYRYQDFQEVLEDIEAYSNGEAMRYCTAASSQATMKVDTQELAKATAASAPPVPPASRGNRTAIAAGLVLFAVAAAAGSWWYLDQKAPPQDEAAADNIAVFEEDQSEADEALADTTATKVDVLADDGADPVVTEFEGAGDSSPVVTRTQTAAVEKTVNSTTDKPAQIVVAAAPAPDYSDPKLVVVVNGDPTVASTIESALEQTLGAAQFSIMNEQFFDGFRAGSDLASLGKVALANGSDVLVVGDVRSTGSRTLEFYGRSERQNIATLQVTAVLPAERRNLGAPWNRDLEYTALNAAEVGGEAAQLIARDLVGRLNELKDAQ